MSNLLIHTIIHNEIEREEIKKIIEKNEKKRSEKENKDLIVKVKIWDDIKIKKLLTQDNKNFSKYYKSLILNKSKEDFAKYIILYHEGGLYVNNYLLRYNKNYYALVDILLSKQKNILFYEEKESLGLERSLLKKDDNIINDDIIYFKNRQSELLYNIIYGIDLNIIPQSQYEVKINLGNYYLTNKVNIFYNKYLGEDEDTYSFNILKNNDIPINDIYKQDLYPNTFDLVDPHYKLKEYSQINEIANYVGLFGLLLFYLLGRWDIFLLYVIILAVGFYLGRMYIYSLVNCKVIKAEIEPMTNQVFYNIKDYPIFKELKENWMLIKKEAEQVLKSSPKLDIYRNYEDWHNSEEYVSKIKDKYGWIRSWKYKDGETVKDGDGNHYWLNYGLLYFGNFFNENTKQCPITTKILSKIKDKINICGFSYLMGNTTIEIHNDETGPSNNSMALHLGLIVPKNNETCKLIMKIGDDYYYETEKEGKFLVFDATNDHYAYNQSNEDRVVLYIDFKL